tara:strand:+ start:4572 stop:4676 length:105 start_codon:yes stop_codon:yes gene_type:complete
MTKLLNNQGQELLVLEGASIKNFEGSEIATIEVL